MAQLKTHSCFETKRRESSNGSCCENRAKVPAFQGDWAKSQPVAMVVIVLLYSSFKLAT